VIANPKARIALCAEKQRLRVLYGQAVLDNSRAIDDILLSRGKTSKDEYERLRLRRDKARHALNSARSALEQHKQEHGC
jgi:ElaB/YqjD/DUF883 family membrane-anchored ribosome-binding protein